MDLARVNWSFWKTLWIKSDWIYFNDARNENDAKHLNRNDIDIFDAFLRRPGPDEVDALQLAREVHTEGEKSGCLDHWPAELILEKYWSYLDCDSNNLTWKNPHSERP